MIKLLRVTLLPCRTLTFNNISKATWRKIDDYSKTAPTPLTMENFRKLCKISHIQEYYDFLRFEILRRLAGMIKEMNNLPRDMSQINTVSGICSLYCSTFEDILYFENLHEHSPENLDKLFRMIKVILDRHKHVLYSLACGMMEYKQRNKQMKTTEDIQTFMDRFLLNRISLRMIMRLNIEAYLAAKNDPSLIDFEYSYIDPNCVIHEVVTDAYYHSKEISEQTYRYDSPELIIEEVNTIDQNKNISCVYPRTHLHLILFEVLKNAMRAVIEHSTFTIKQQCSDQIQHSQFIEKVEAEIANRPISVKIYKGPEDITICIKDLGGGFPFALSHGLFQYLFTTANVNLLNDNNICSEMYSTGIAPIAGFGCGLPISRLYARYFTGDLKISTIEGLGTTAYVYLKVKPSEAREIIPVYTSVMKKIYRSQNLAPQWTGKKL